MKKEQKKKIGNLPNKGEVFLETKILILTENTTHYKGSKFDRSKIRVNKENIRKIFKNDKIRPDVTIVYNDGTFKFIEVKSLTDDRVKLENKLRDLQTKYGKDVIKDFEVVNPKGGK